MPEGLATRRRLGVGAALAVLVLAALAALAVVLHHHQAQPAPPRRPGEHDVTAWTPTSSRPLTDAQAAALVVHQPEQRPGNVAANDYVPTDSQLAAFHAARDSQGQTTTQFNPLLRYVTGRAGLEHPSTDDLIQWVSHKWGIPTNWIRAQVDYESGWHQTERGDEKVVGRSTAALYPPFSRARSDTAVYQSLGIAQVKWTPSGSVGAGTEPLRWKSTAFNLDYFAAMLRYYYDGYCHWCAPGYRPGQAWETVGAWYEPEPWNNAFAQHYSKVVKGRLSDENWTKAGF